MLNETPLFSRYNAALSFRKLWEDDPEALVRSLPQTNPVNDILSIHAFNVMKLCWKLDPEQRPKMMRAQSLYDIEMRPSAITG